MEKTVFFGTMTGDDSAGIYAFRPERSAEPELVLRTVSPAYLIKAGKERILWLGEYEGGCTVGAAEIRDGTFCPVGELSSASLSGACHLSLSRDGRTLFLACYGGQQVGTVRLSEEGLPLFFGPVLHHGEMFGKPCHPHWSSMVPETDCVVFADLGLGALVFYRSAEENLIPENVFFLPKGCGCRHGVFGEKRNGIYPLYLITELSNEFYEVDIEPETLNCTLVRRENALPDGYVCHSAGGAIRLSPDGKTVAVSNRLLNGGNGILTLLDPEGKQPPRYYDSGVVHPRDFCFADDKTLLCCGFRNDTVSLLDLEKGDILRKITIPSPASVLVAEL